MIQKCSPRMTLKNCLKMMMIVYFYLFLEIYDHFFKVDVKHPRNQSKTWYKIEDQTLIQNYDQFKDLPNSEDHLCLLINNMGFSDKEPIDVHKILVES